MSKGNHPGETFEERLRRFRDVCRENGLKVTHQRLEIFRDVAGDVGHPSVEAVYKRLKERMPTISLDTIYRTLSTFERLGLISRVQILDNVGRFDANMTRHHHLVCTRCHAIEDFYWPVFDGLDLSFATQGWGAVAGKRAEIWGVCRSCQQAARPELG